jgi:hypothetical protein
MFRQLSLRVLSGSNMIRGFLIFVVFICKRSVWEMTKRRHPKLLRIAFAPLNCVLKKCGAQVPILLNTIFTKICNVFSQICMTGFFTKL